MGLSRLNSGTPLEVLLAEIQKDGEQKSRAVDELIRRFEPLTRKIGRLVAGDHPYRDDVENAARMGLVTAMSRHSGPEESFPAYAKLYMLGAARREVRHCLPDREWPTAEPEAAGAEPQTLVDFVHETAFLNGWGDGQTAAIVATLTQAQQHLLVRRYIEDVSLEAIAQEEACSRPAVSQRLKTIHRRLGGLMAA